MPALPRKPPGSHRTGTWSQRRPSATVEHMSGNTTAATGQAPAPVVPGRAFLSRHQSRPGRRALVAADLAELRGPAAGPVELPLRLFWSLPGHRFDLDDPDTRRWYYET